jgi:hypothetical protein
LTDFQIGKNDMCKFCLLKNKKNNFLSGLKNFYFLKWKIFQKINQWTRYYSYKIKIKICWGHILTPSDQSVEKIIFNLKKNKINNYRFYYPRNYSINCLKHSFENLNFFQICSRTRLLYFSKKRILKPNFLIFKKYETIPIQNTTIQLNCVIDIILYKESFLKIDFNLYEYCLFIFIWNFFENFNFISITLELFYNIFQKRLSSYLTYYTQFIKNLIMFYDQEKFNNSLSGKLKNFVRKTKFNLYYFLSIDSLESEFNKISISNGKLKIFKFVWYFSFQTSLNQKIKWSEIKVLIDLISLTKENLTEKFKILFKTIRKKKKFE